LTQVVIDGWYVNEIQPGDYKRLYISGGLISGGTYTSCSINPTPTNTPTPTPTPTQFCKKYTGVQTFQGTGAKYVYTACNGITGEYLLPNASILYSPTIYATSPPTKQSGNGEMTWTDNGFQNACSASTFTRITSLTNLGTYWNVVDCGGASYTQSPLSSGQSFTGCFTSLSCSANCTQGVNYSRTDYGSCST
jgi:hypothetical protein